LANRDRDHHHNIKCYSNLSTKLSSIVQCYNV